MYLPFPYRHCKCTHIDSPSCSKVRYFRRAGLRIGPPTGPFCENKERMVDEKCPSPGGGAGRGDFGQPVGCPSGPDSRGEATLRKRRRSAATGARAVPATQRGDERFRPSSREAIPTQPVIPRFLHDGAMTGWATARRACARTPRSSSPFRSRRTSRWSITRSPPPNGDRPACHRDDADSAGTRRADYAGRTSAEPRGAGGGRALRIYAQGVPPSAAAAHAIAEFQKLERLLHVTELRRFADRPQGHDPRNAAAGSSRTCRRIPTDGFKPGLCSHCHSGPLLNKTNLGRAFIGLPIPAGQRFSKRRRLWSMRPGTRSISSCSTKARTKWSSESPDLGCAMFTGQLESPCPSWIRS